MSKNSDVFLIYDTIKCKFSQQTALAHSLNEFSYVVCYEDKRLVNAFCNKMPNGYEERSKISIEQIRELWQTFNANHFVAFGKVHSKKELSSALKDVINEEAQKASVKVPLITPPAPPIMPEPELVKPKKMNSSSFLDSSDDDCVMHNFAHIARNHCSIADDELLISPISSSWNITFNKSVKEAIVAQQLFMLLVREDKTLGTIHFVFNDERGVPLTMKKDGTYLRVANKKMVVFLLDKFGISEAKRKEKLIIKISKNLSRRNGILTYQIFSIKPA